jgi:hypothetical protein
MSTAEILSPEAQGHFLPEHESALSSSADFSLGGPHLRLVDEDYEPGPPQIVDVLLDQTQEGQGAHPAHIIELKEYMKGLLESQKDKYYRNKMAAYYGEHYRGELDISTEGLTYGQQSNLVLAKLYFSSLSSLGELGMFIDTNRWMGNKAPEAETAKVEYLAARKVYQDDVDKFFEHFEDEPDETLLDVLKDVSNLARLTVNQREFLDAATDDHTHVFVGSVLSERLVKISMQEFIDPATRYGDENEDRSPTQADVVWPRPVGDVHVQVKMRWTKPTELKVKLKKKPKPTHVILPMQYLRSGLTPEEHAKVTTIISEVAERQLQERKWQEACALSGLKKQIAICRIPVGEFRSWWSELKEIIQEEKKSHKPPLQTGVNELELAS